MTTPTPPTWMTCDHRGIGLPGCPTCDGRLDPETRRMLLELAQFTAVKIRDAHAAEAECARLRETLDQLIAALRGPHGIGPWTRTGGPMPEPWPGMGVTVRLDMRLFCVTIHTLSSGITGEWWGETPEGAIIRPRDVIMVWDGRRCIWRRE